jgi:AcrR family transcriptional regulator
MSYKKRPTRPAQSDKALHSRSIWLRQGATPRSAQRITRARVVKQAVELMDSEGVNGLTMRRLAERLGTGSATLYWHVKTKDDVLELALDSVFGEIPVPTDGQSRHWQQNITMLMMGWRATLVRHPWTTALPGRPLIGPNILVRMEFLHATLVRAGFPADYLAPVTWCLCNYVMGAVTAQVNWHMRREERGIAQDFLNAHRNDYPTLAAQGYMLYEDREAAFKQALTYLIDGIEAHRSREKRGRR